MITWHTSGSTRAPSPRTGAGPSCTCLGSGQWRKSFISARQLREQGQCNDARAISGESGSSALGSVSIEQIESKTAGERRMRWSAAAFKRPRPAGWRGQGCAPFEMVSAGDHWSLRMSRQMDPFELMLGW